MTDHADHFPMTKPFDLEDVTVALHNIADAIRGLTPNATQDATGCPQIDPQPEPGQVDGDRATEATGGDFPCCGAPNIPYRATVYADVVARAEKAEAERDRLEARVAALLDDLAVSHGQAFDARTERDHLVGVIDGAEQRTRMAEAERDAILADLHAAFRNWTHDAGYPIASRIAEVISRHTTEG